MVDVTVDGDAFASLRIAIGEPATHYGENAYVAAAQAQLVALGYAVDNEVTYVVRDPEPGEQTRLAPDA